ncbi:MAG: DEAD/DEAH box helicase [Gammaproteobacteria bacterium]|nr:DEAD/DEAH box helicase [Gammaproteobacteria bacterium]
MNVQHQSQGDVVIDAQVRDLRHIEYHLDFEMAKRDGEIDVFGVCSCGSHSVCSHMVAVIMAYERHFLGEDKIDHFEPECMQWLQRLDRSRQSTTQAVPAKSSFLLYHLRSQDAGELALNFTVAKLKKNGQLGKGRVTTMNTLNPGFGHRPDYLSELDIEIIQLIAMMDEGSDYYGYFNRYAAETVSFNGELGSLLLQKLIASGRCYTNDNLTKTLTLGETRPIVFAWSLKQGFYVLNSRAAEGGVPLLADPPRYFDDATAEIGPLDLLGMLPAQLQELLKAPLVPQDLAVKFSERLVTEFPGIVIPPPKKLKIRELKAVTPLKLLTLSGTQQGQNYNHQLQLAFSYQQHAVDAQPTQPFAIISGAETLRIHRDLQDEADALARLTDFGFSVNQQEVGYHGPIVLRSMATSQQESVERWEIFQQQLRPELEQEGWQITTADSFLMEFYAAEAVAGEIAEGDNAWFDLRFDLLVNGEKIALLPLITALLDEYTPDTLPPEVMVPIRPHHYVRMDSAPLRPILNTLYELFDRDRLQADGSLKLSRFDAARLDEIADAGSGVRFNGGEMLRALGKRLRDFTGIAVATVPQGFHGTLRSYQHQGLNWLQFLREYGLAGILADDMGLGKTVQALCHIQLEQEAGRLTEPVLIIAPTSLMGNWRREAALFTPELKVLVLQGSERHQGFDKISEYQIILTTYPLLPRDHEVLLRHHYHTVILDEAQVIKNPKAKASQLVRHLRCDHRLCLTGTPMENHLGEMWALFDFLLPGFLGSSEEFTRLYRTPIEKQGDLDRRQRLAQRIRPFMLRRRKQDVETELPPKTEILRTIPLGAAQAAFYESIRLSMEAKVRAAIASKGFSRSQITILDALLKLRQTCCDPRLLKLEAAQAVQASAKLELLMELLPEMLDEGRRILLFSQFTSMLKLIEEELMREGIAYTKLTGQTRDRDQAINRFCSGEVSLFLISLKAGGVGLNLTEADTVIHYDPWWNPAVEAQATDRAHRIGQERPVFVYKLITEKTVEEKIVAMQQRKQALANGIYNNAEQQSAEGPGFNADELIDLFRSN